MYSNSLELDLDVALESLDNILMTDDEKYASMEAYLDELVSHDSYDEVYAMFESVYEYDTVMEEDNGNNKKGIIEKIKKAIAWLKKKFFDIVSAIGGFFRKIVDFFKNLFKGKFKSKKQKIAELESEIDQLKKDYEKTAKVNVDLRDSNNNLVKESMKEKAKHTAEYMAKFAEAEGYKAQYELEKKMHELDNKENRGYIDLYSDLYKNSEKRRDEEYEKHQKENKENQKKIDEYWNKNRDLKNKLYNQEEENEELKKKIEVLNKQIAFLKNGDFDKKFEKNIRSNLSDDKINAMINYTENDMKKTFKDLSDVQNLIEQLTNSYSKNVDLEALKEEPEYVIGPVMKRISAKMKNVVETITNTNYVKNVDLQKYIHDPSVFFDQNKINTIKRYSENFKRNTDRSTAEIKKQLNILTERAQKIQNDQSNTSEESIMLKNSIYYANKILTEFGRFSSISANYTMKIVNSVLEVQKIYLSTLNGRV